MPIPSPPTFHHTNNVIDNYIDYLFKNPSLPDRTQLILMAGIALSNVDLIKYAGDIDPNVVNIPVPNHILTITDSIMSEVTGITLSQNPPQVDENTAENTSP